MSKIYLRRLGMAATLAIGCLLTLLAAGAEVYRVIDADGNVIYTDTPEAGKPKEEVELPPINLQPAVTPSARAKEPPKEAIHYEARIVEPSNDSTIPPGQLDVAVRVELKPVLQPGHRLELTLDGEPQGKASVSTTFRLSELNRGSHQIVARVKDADDLTISSSPAVVIHVKRHSVKHPSGPQAPAPRR